MKTVMMSGILVASLALVGCASTGSGTKTDAQGYPVLEVLSNTPYVWDDSISEALNVARMAQPARVGQGMRDFTDGRQAGVGGRSSTGERVAGGLLSGVGMGLYGVVSSEVLTGRVDRELSWNPAIVEIVDSSKFQNSSGIDYKTIRNHLAEKIIAAVKADHPEISVGPVMTLVSRSSSYRGSSIAIEDEICREMVAFERRLEPHEVTIVTNVPSRFFIDGPDYEMSYCTLSFNVSVARTINEANLVLVAELKYGALLHESVIRNYEGYVLVPEMYVVNSVRLSRPYAFLSKHGEEMLFQHP